MSRLTDDTHSAGQPPLSAVVIGLAITQMIGWGTTYFLPGVLATEFAAATGLPQASVYLGVTLMVLLGAFSGALAGRFTDRRGARPGLVIGVLLLALGLVVLSQAQGPVGYFAAWACFGLAMPLGLTQGASAALVQYDPARARRAIGSMLLLSVLAQAIFWPLTVWLEPQIGWRRICLLYAMLNVIVCLPLHLGLLRVRASGEAASTVRVELQGSIPLHRRRLAAVLFTLAVSLGGFVSWGLDLHMIALMGALGLAPALAVAVASARGPISMAARTFDILLAGRVSALLLAIVASTLTFLSFLVLWLAEWTGVTGGNAAAIAFIVLFATGTGVMTVARATLPLTLFGSAGFASITGAIGLPTQLAFAAAPPLYALVLQEFGVGAMVRLSAIACAGSVVALVGLRAICAPPTDANQG
ncbi:MAG: MFS transporter [Beijerinckiaceae bacterium]